MQIVRGWRRLVQASCFSCAVLRTFTCFGLVVVWLPAPPIDDSGRWHGPRALDQAGGEQGCMSAVNEAKSQIGAQLAAARTD